MNKNIKTEDYTLKEYTCDDNLPENGKLYRKVMGVDPETLVGQVQPFYGAHSDCFKFGDIVFEVLENPDDGYRSSMDMMLIHPDQDMSGFFQAPLANVRLESVSTVSVEFENEPWNKENDESPTAYDHYQGWRLVDVKDDHVWLEFGTKNYDDWYPMFWFYYNPKEASQQTD